MNLKEKIAFEKEQYFDYLLLNSKAALIDRANEIAVKKALYEKLYAEADRLPEKLAQKIELTDDVVEYIYLKKKENIELTNGSITSFTWARIMNELTF